MPEKSWKWGASHICHLKCIGGISRLSPSCTCICVGFVWPICKQKCVQCTLCSDEHTDVTETLTFYEITKLEMLQKKRVLPILFVFAFYWEKIIATLFLPNFKATSQDIQNFLRDPNIGSWPIRCHSLDYMVIFSDQ